MVTNSLSINSFDIKLTEMSTSRGGHWGLSETGKPVKISIKTKKPEEKPLKTEKPSILIKTAN